MAGEINYKQKYQELKLKFMNAVDVAFRLGYEQGMNAEKMNSAQEHIDAMAEASRQDAQQPANQGSQGSEESKEPSSSESSSVDAQGTELDQHISELESVLTKAEIDGVALEQMQKTLNLMKSLRPSKNPFMHEKASHNVSENSKAALTMQEKIVKDIMDAWDSEKNNSSKDILKVLSREGLSE